jgi:hypothetical protein
MTDHIDTPPLGTVINFADFVANHRRPPADGDAPETETRQLELEFPAPPRPLSARSIAHRRRMLTHLISATRR